MIELLMDGIHLSFWWIMDHLLIINIILSILIIFFQRRNPTTVWTWLLVLYFIPGTRIYPVPGVGTEFS